MNKHERIQSMIKPTLNNNIQKIFELFPNCVTETKDKNGTRKVIDIDKLRQELSESAIDGPKERYGLNWPDKRKSVLLANSPTSICLRPFKEESSDFDNAKNIYIEGDNLDVLKCLRETYLGRIKVIYIDPPYNTGNDFIYKDNFLTTKETYLTESGQVDEVGNKLTANLESNGRFHTDWLNMMYPRLKLSRDFLSDDGVIFISIDNNELYSTKFMCDEIFGEDNFVGNIIIQTSTDNNPTQIKTEHEYIICYARNKNNLTPWTARSDKVDLIKRTYQDLKGKHGNDIQAIQKELRQWIKSNKEKLNGFTHYDNVDDKGVFHDGDIANTSANGYKYDVIHPVTKRICKIPPNGYRYPESSIKKMIEEGDIMFGEDETTLIKPKKRLENAKDVLRSVIYEDGRASTKAFEALMARDIFQNPKSPTVLSRLFGFILNDGDIVLDFFAGSGTTAEAVLKCNQDKNINAHYILIQLPENLDESINRGTKKSRQTTINAIRFLDSINKPHNLSEIAKERIRRINNQYNCYLFGNQMSGFRVFKADSSNIIDIMFTPDQVDQGDLFRQSDNVKPDRTAEDILIQTMLSLGIPLDSSICEEFVQEKKIFNVADNYLIACFEKNITNEVMEIIAKKQPVYVVLRDSCFSSDSVADNFEQIFRTYATETVCKVI